MRSRVLIAVGCLLFAGCGPDEPAEQRAAPSDTLTQGARDSAVARSGLPGAGAVGTAQEAAGAAADRAARLDSLQRPDTLQR